MSKYSDWTDTGVVNRNYHMLHALAKDERVNKIIAVDFLPFTWKRAVKTFLIDQVKKDRRGELVYGDITTQTWQITSKIYVYSSIDTMLRPGRVAAELRQIIDRLDMEDNLIVWSCNPLYVDYFDTIPSAATIFDAVDNWAEHSSYHRFKKRLMRNYKRIAERSDRIYTVSEDLLNVFKTPKARWLPNAVDFDHFQQGGKIKELANKPRPILGFLGILQDRVDVDLLHTVARRYPNATVVLAGPVWKGFPRESFDVYPNVVFTGPVAYRNIPKMYNTFDVGLIAYKKTDFIKSTNSMKYYEYLAAGLPVVSTWSGGIEQFGDIITVAHTDDEFLAGIDRALAENSPERVAQRQAFVQPMTWKARIQTVFEDLEKLLE